MCIFVYMGKYMCGYMYMYMYLYIFKNSIEQKFIFMFSLVTCSFAIFDLPLDTRHFVQLLESFFLVILLFLRGSSWLIPNDSSDHPLPLSNQYI